MADVMTAFNELKFEYQFVDGDTRIQTIKNPKETITTEQIQELNSYIQANNLLVGDKNGATFGKIRTVTKVSGTTTKLDLA